MCDKVERRSNGGGVLLLLVAVRDLFLAMCEMYVFRYKQHSSRDKPPHPTLPKPPHPSLPASLHPLCLLKCACLGEAA